MLMTELYHIKNETAIPIIDLMLNKRNVTYNFRNFQKFQLGRTKFVLYSLKA